MSCHRLELGFRGQRGPRPSLDWRSQDTPSLFLRVPLALISESLFDEVVSCLCLWFPSSEKGVGAVMGGASIPPQARL